MPAKNNKHQSPGQTPTIDIGRKEQAPSAYVLDLTPLQAQTEDKKSARTLNPKLFSNLIKKVRLYFYNKISQISFFCRKIVIWNKFLYSLFRQQLCLPDYHSSYQPYVLAELSLVSLTHLLYGSYRRVLTAVSSVSLTTLTPSLPKFSRLPRPPAGGVKSSSFSWKPLLAFAGAALLLIAPFQALTYYQTILASKEKILQLANFTKTIEQQFNQTVATASIFAKILGAEQTQRYLLIFQNSNELRPTGGFIGSYALIDIDRGKLKKVEIPATGPYDLRGELAVKVIAPEPLHLVSGLWQFHDANWFPDFPASAKKLIWFYEKSGGPSVDGVIAITNSFASDLLNITGPVPMPDYEKIITGENFTLELQKAVEIEYDKKENKPKKIIADLVPKIIEKISAADSQTLAAILRLAQQKIKSKDILFYSVDPKIEKQILQYGWAGEMKNSNNDFLAIVHSNIGGAKTDAVIKERIQHQTALQENNSIINTLIITRAHQGQVNDVFTGVPNIDYLRVYVPANSILLAAEGFTRKPDPLLFETVDADCLPDEDLKIIEGVALYEPKSGMRISQEFGKTVFGNWVITRPGETTKIVLQYQLPAPLSIASRNNLPLSKKILSYSLLVQKQPGFTNELTKELTLPSSYNISWQYPKNSSSPLILSQDQFFALLAEKDK